MNLDLLTPAMIARIHHRHDCRGVELSIFIGSAGDPMVKCFGCGRSVPVHFLHNDSQPDAGPTPAPSRHWLICVRCEALIPLASSRKRVPLCSHCQRPKKKPDPNEEISTHDR